MVMIAILSAVQYGMYDIAPCSPEATLVVVVVVVVVAVMVNALLTTRVDERSALTGGHTLRGTLI